MKRIALLGVLAGVAWSAPPETLTRARSMEQQGRPLEARALLSQTAQEHPQDVEAMLGYAEFLDRHGDQAAAQQAYGRALEAAPVTGYEERRRQAARRLAALALAAGDAAQFDRARESFTAAGGAGLRDPAKIHPLEGYGSTQIPGILNSFLRMAALSTDLEPHDLLPALARNVVTGGYRTARGGEALEATEYLKLLQQYLTQARELLQFAGPDGSLDVPACESEETASLLRILGYRLRGECGPDAVLETVNPSRAFLSIDSAFPLAELEAAYRREEPFRHPYASTELPVLFGVEYWTEGASKLEDGDFIDVFLANPGRARLYVALEKLHRPTAEALRELAPAEDLQNYANVIDFFGGMFEIRDGRAVVPGDVKIWDKIVGVSPSKGAEFYLRLMRTDDGWLAAYYDALMRAQGPALAYFTEPARLERLYGALRGRVTSPGPARPIFRSTADLLLLTSRLDFDASGAPRVPGGLEVWKKLFTDHPHGKYDGKLTKSASGWQNADDLVEALFALSRKMIENEPLEIFLTVTNIERERRQPLATETVARLIDTHPRYGGQAPLFTETASLSDETMIAYLDMAERLDKIGSLTRRSDAIGTAQALTGLWQILVRQGQIPESAADAVLRKLIEPFFDIGNEQEIFDAGRQGVLALLEAAGRPSGASPQDEMTSLLAGSPGDGERQVHREMVQRLNTLFNQQRLVSLKALFDLADHLERVSRGESFNVAMANRLAAVISEVRLPRSELSTQESNAFANGSWVENHIRQQREMNLRRLVDRAQGNPNDLLQIRGEMTPVLRDTLVGLVYIYYAPPGAELIRANPLFVRSHDFLGPEQARSWEPARLQGAGWPSSAGGRLVGSLVGLAYGLNDIEQNFLVPSKRQALIWQDLAPQVLLTATVPRWWGVTSAEMHYAALHLRLGQAIVDQAALDEAARKGTLDRLRRRVQPGRLWLVDRALEAGRIGEARGLLAPAEFVDLACDAMREKSDWVQEVGAPFAAALVELENDPEAKLDAQRLASLFGTPHPELSGSYRSELLHLPLFPTLMGYSSRILAESWESTNLYWAALADEAHLPPAQLNLLAPAWTKKALERIFATHLEDWPALLHSMRVIGEDYRAAMRPELEQSLRAAAP